MRKKRCEQVMLGVFSLKFRITIKKEDREKTVQQLEQIDSGVQKCGFFRLKGNNGLR
jgi:hypothetical protein